MTPHEVAASVAEPRDRERADRRHPLSPVYRRTTAGVVCVVLLVAFEAMAVATAMPIAARDLHGLSLYAWAFTGFLIASLFGTVLAGEACDRLGPRLPLLLGVMVFVVGLVVAGSAPTMWLFIVGRLVQGLGGGITIVALYVVVAQAYPPALRPRMFSYTSAAWVVPSIVGPLVAGVLAEHVTWRLVFWGLVPLVVAPVVLLLPALRSLPRPEGTHRTGRVRLALALAVGVGLLQYGGGRAEHRDWPVAGLMVAAGLVLMLPTMRRLLPAGTLRLGRGLPSVVALRGAMAAAFFSAESFVPLMLVSHRGLSATVAGLSLTGAALGWAAGSWWQGRPALRTSRSRLAVLGAAVATAGIVVTGSSAVDTTTLTVPAWLAAVGWSVAGVGMGLVMSSMSVLLFELSPVADQGANSAALQMSDALGSIVAIAAAGVVYAVLRNAVAGTVVFGAIFAIALLVGLVAIVVSTRVAETR